MTDRTLRRLAWSLCALTLLALAASLFLILLGWSTPLPQGATPWRDRAISLVGIVGAPILGGLIASRRPRNAYGWVWLGFGLSLALAQLGSSISAYARVVESETLMAPLAVAHVLKLGNQVSLGLAPFLFLLFPTGRLPSRRWRPVAWVSVLSGAMIILLVLLFGSPDKVGGMVSSITIGVVFIIFATIALSALSLLVRYRRASGVERQQLKWVAFAAVLAASTLMSQQLLWLAGLLNVYLLGGELPTSNPSLDNLRDAATNVCYYVGVGIAILRYRLYDIDIIINRTLVYGTLTVSLALIYFGGVTATQAVFQAFTGQQRLPQLAAVASTLAIAALFNPLRRGIQNVIDRRFYRRKYDASRTLEEFSAKLREETDLDALSSDLLSTVRETVQPEHVSLWLRPESGPKNGPANYGGSRKG
jgi:hypothetical protein